MSTVTSSTTSVSTKTSVSKQVKKIKSNELVRIEIIPYTRAQKIYFKATGLSPNCRHFAFFDQVAVDDWCREETFTTVATDPTEYGNRYNRATRHPEGTSQLFSDAQGTIEGSFFLPNTNTIRFRTGDREFRLIDISVYEPNNAISTAFTVFASNGRINYYGDTYLKTTTILTTRTITTTITNTTTKTATNTLTNTGGDNDDNIYSYDVDGDGRGDYYSRSAALRDGWRSGDINLVPRPVEGPDPGQGPNIGGGGESSDACFVAGTMIKMADGTEKAIEDIDLNDNVKHGGLVWGIGQFIVDDIHDYEGVRVSGSHLVKENGLWTRVRDSNKAVLLDDETPTRVYIFACENHILETYNGVIFSDF
jgi:hypothetical protein